MSKMTNSVSKTHFAEFNSILSSRFDKEADETDSSGDDDDDGKICLIFENWERKTTYLNTVNNTLNLIVEGIFTELAFWQHIRPNVFQKYLGSTDFYQNSLNSLKFPHANFLNTSFIDSAINKSEF